MILVEDGMWRGQLCCSPAATVFQVEAAPVHPRAARHPLEHPSHGLQCEGCQLQQQDGGDGKQAGGDGKQAGEVY